MTANVKALIASNLILVATLMAFAFVAFPSSAEANSPRVKVFRGDIEFRSTIPCDRQGAFVRDSQKQGNFYVVSTEDGFFNSVEFVSGISTTTTTISGSGLVPKTVVTSVTPRTSRYSSFQIYGCTASVVTGVR
jgi:hypothetical protein